MPTNMLKKSKKEMSKEEYIMAALLLIGILGTIYIVAQALMYIF